MKKNGVSAHVIVIGMTETNQTHMCACAHTTCTRVCTKYVGGTDPKVHGLFTTPGCHRSNRIKTTKLCCDNWKTKYQGSIWNLLNKKLFLLYVQQESIKKLEVPIMHTLGITTPASDIGSWLLSSFCVPGISNIISLNPLKGLMKFVLFSFLTMEGEALRS